MTFYYSIDLNALRKFLSIIFFFLIYLKSEFKKYFSCRPTLDHDPNYGHKCFYGRNTKAIIFYFGKIFLQLMFNKSILEKTVINIVGVYEY